MKQEEGMNEKVHQILSDCIVEFINFFNKDTFNTVSLRELNEFIKLFMEKHRLNE